MEHIIALVIQYKYLILFPLAAIEGPIIALVIGFLIHMGHLAFLPSYFILLLGDIIPDSVYYYLGRFGDEKNLLEKYASKESFVREHFPLVEKLWEKHPFKTMFFSKLAYGLSTIFLISAGLVKMPFRKFLEYAVPITLFQYGVILAIGYLLGNSYAAASSYIKYTGIIVAIAVIAFISLYISFTKYARKKLLKMEEEEILKETK